MLQPNEFRACREKGKSSMYATSMGYRLTQSSSALVVNGAGEAGQNCAYSLSMLTRLRLDAPPRRDHLRRPDRQGRRNAYFHRANLRSAKLAFFRHSQVRIICRLDLILVLPIAFRTSAVANRTAAPARY